MTTRLDRFVDAEQLVHEWLTTSRGHPDRATYLRSTIRTDPRHLGIHGIITHLEAAAGPGTLRTVDRQRLTRAKADALFLFALGENVDEEANHFANTGILRLAFLSLARDRYGQIDLLDSQPFEVPFGEVPGPPDLAAWVATVRPLLDEIEVEDRVRAALEARYFRGRSVLFEDTVDAWNRLRWLVSSLEDDFRTIPPKLRSARRAALTPVDPDVVARRVQDRFKDFRDLAKVDGLRQLGARSLADKIIERHIDGLER